MNLFWVGAFLSTQSPYTFFEIYYRMFPFLDIAALRECVRKEWEKRLDPVSEVRELELHHQKVT